MVRHDVRALAWVPLALTASLVSVAVGCTTVFAAATAVDAKANDPLASLDVRALRSGDLVFRAGRGWRSQAVRAASGFTLTHVGIVDRQADGRIYVVHADPPEGAKQGRVRRVPITSFGNPAEAQAVMAFRPDQPRSFLNAMVMRARKYAERNVPFDEAFDLDTTNKVYCTELVWRAFAESGIQLKTKTTRIYAGIFAGEYMTPRDLLAMDHFVRVGGRE